MDKERFVLVAVGSSQEVWESWGLHPDIHCFTRPELKQQSFKILMGKVRDTSHGGRVLVLAGTPWQLQSLPEVLDEKLSAKKRQAGQVPTLFDLDLLVVDEASQMPVTAASCVVQLLQRSEKKHGHAVFVGDEHQLPPVMKGIYTERSLAHQRFYTDFASCLHSCADCDQIPAHALCVGASFFNRGLALELLAPWDVASQQPGPQAKLLRAGNGPYADLFLQHQDKVFGSFLDLTQAILGVEGGRGAGEDLATLGTAASARHFFQVDMDVLPIERSVFECLHVGNERARCEGG